MLIRNSVLGLALVTSLLGTAVGCTTSDGKGGGGTGANGNGSSGGPVAGDPNSGTQSAKFFLPTGEPTNTSAPVIEIDKKGGIHALYPAYVRGGAFYAYCPSTCTGPEQMKVVPFETDGTVGNAMLALDAQGQPQVLLSSALKLYYARPAAGADYTDPASWKTSVILDHGGEREVTGEAFALDAQGHPRFLMHVYKAFLGVGQKTPATFYVTCDDNCNEAASWTQNKIADDIWRGSSLRFDAKGVAHVATTMPVGKTESSSGVETGAYLECAADCGNEKSWNGIGLLPIYESEYEAVRVTPSISVALTKSGAPRLVELGKKDDKKAVVYFQCDEDCTHDHWTASVISDSDKLGAGVDIAVDANDHPRFVYTINYNIGLYACDEANCATADAKWNLSKVELGSEMKPDEIFLYENCTVGAWFLHSPSIALDPAGHPRVGYQARDISGGFKNPSPATKPDCVAGTDMTWSRLALMPSAFIPE